jgi:peptidylamidoglycolate lyase
MSRRIGILVAGVVGCLMIYLFGGRLLPVLGQAGVAHSYAAIPGEKGGQDTWGPYTIAENWPKPLSALPGNEKWTWGAAEGIFAESPNRIYLFERGELPVLTRPKNTPIPQFGPSLSFPTNEVPFRNASQGPVAALPGEGAAWQGKEGVDAKWEHCLLVVDSEGNIVEDWSQWNSLFKRPHSIYINEYDPTKAVWAVDDARHAIFKFSHDGKELLQTLGTPNVPGNDDKHFNRPTFIAWLPDGSMFVSDGYANTRVVKFDKNGKYLMTWGQKGNPPNETRPSYFNTVHGIAADPVTKRVYVNDRTNRRIQVFDEDGKFLDMWSTGPYLSTQAEKTSNPGGTGTSTVYSLYMPASRYLWAPDSKTWKILKYDREGHFLYSWGTLGLFPGGLWGVHQISTDTDGNFYTAEVSYGHFQKFVPRKGANPDFLIGPPVRSAWR